MTSLCIKSECAPLLTDRDLAPVTLLNEASTHPVLLVCEHAGQGIPESLLGLGLKPGDLDRHIGWDIGAAAVTRRLAHMSGAPAVMQNFSRLVIDCNRPPEATDAMPTISDQTTVPGNWALSEDDRAARVREIFTPYQSAVSAALSHPARRLVISIHSFTPILAGVVRHWDVAFLYRGDAQSPAHLRQSLLLQDPTLTIGMNEPYQIEDASDWFVPRHGEASGLPHSLIEIRNDLISENEGQDRWAALLNHATKSVLEGIHR